jgi:hypothetical protein
LSQNDTFMPRRLYYRHRRSTGRLEPGRLVVLHYVRSFPTHLICSWSTTWCQALDSIHHGEPFLKMGRF